MSAMMHEIAIDSFCDGLESLVKLLDAGAAHASAKKIDLANARLAPDMFTLAQQVQQACFWAKDGTLRLIGRGPEAGVAAGKNFAEMKRSIAATIGELREVKVAAFDGAEGRDIRIEPPNAGIVIAMNGPVFLRAWALPQFYFHLVTAYDILRHNGVAIGKRDYMSWVGAYVRPKE